MVGVDSVLNDRYRLEEKIASGGMGSVYRATDEKLGRTVAIKLLASNLADDASFVERFRREAGAAAGLRHPNVANVFDAGDEGDCHFIVMELAEGRDLARLLREEGPLASDRAVNIVDQICLALGHAHAAGIVHRDVKPANVIVDDSDTAKVTDFGIARAADESKLTVTGSVLGTAHYISPEQAEGKQLSASSDIYSLGIVMFEVLTGALPFTGDSLMAVAMRHINETVPLPSTINTSVPGELDEIVARVTAKDPADRFRDASEMHRALASALVPTNTSTAVLEPAATTVSQGTVWPIPGDRWDPVSLGRKVMVVFGFLGLVALILLAWRLASSDAPPAKSERQRPAERTTAPPSSTLLSDVRGMDYEAAQTVVASAGYKSEVEFVKDEELLDHLSVTGMDPALAEEGVVVNTEPRSGSTLEEGQTITLFVSEGLPSDDGDHEPGDKGKGKSRGKGHGKEDD